jgi:hypothetical protein
MTMNSPSRSDPDDIVESPELSESFDGTLWIAGAGLRAARRSRGRSVPAIRPAVLPPAPMEFRWMSIPVVPAMLAPGIAWQKHDTMIFCYDEDSRSNHDTNNCFHVLEKRMGNNNMPGGIISFNGYSHNWFAANRENRFIPLEKFKPVRFPQPLIDQGDRFCDLENRVSEWEDRRHELPAMFLERGLDIRALFQSLELFLRTSP